MIPNSLQPPTDLLKLCNLRMKKRANASATLQVCRRLAVWLSKLQALCMTSISFRTWKWHAVRLGRRHRANPLGLEIWRSLTSEGTSLPCRCSKALIVLFRCTFLCVSTFLHSQDVFWSRAEKDRMYAYGSYLTSWMRRISQHLDLGLELYKLSRTPQVSRSTPSIF
jgi:hypothetical protein